MLSVNTSGVRGFKNASGSIQQDYSQFGFYLDTDGTWYTTEGNPLGAVDLSTGESMEEDGSWYDIYGNPEAGNQGGNISYSMNVSSPSGSSVSSGSGTGLLGGFLSGIGTAFGSVLGKSVSNATISNGVPQGGYSPLPITPASNTNNTALIIVAIVLVVGGGITIAMVSRGKK